MINIVTKIEDGKSVIQDVESFFSGNIDMRNITDVMLDCMKKIDDAELIDRRRGTISTKFGTTTIENLSTGCKAVLVYLYMVANKSYHSVALNITECGFNALSVLFDIYTVAIPLLLQHSDNIYVFDNLVASVNGHVVDSLDDGMVLYG